MKPRDRQRTLLVYSAGVAGLALLCSAGYLLWPERAGPSREMIARRTGKPAANPSPVRFRWHLEGAPRMNIREVSDDHYAISSPDKVNFFLFKVEGAAGRTLRFTFEGIPAQHWKAIRPVCGYPVSPGEGDLDDPACYEPDEKGQSRWQSMTQMDLVSDREIAYTHRFEKDAAYVALRVPYTLGYQRRWLASLPKQKGVETVELGKSDEGRPLTLIKIGAGDEQAESTRPCVLMYAREHGDEPDSSWAVHGALRFLIGESAEAAALREKFTFLLIPMLDPDGWARGLHDGIVSDFRETAKPGDALIYAVWAKKWFDSGRRLDLVLNLHNPEPRAYAHVLCPRIEPGLEREKWGRTILAETGSQFYTVGMSMRSEPASIGMSPGRFGNYLSLCYGALHVPLEINSQNPKRRLSLSDTEAVGRNILLGTCRFFELPQSQVLVREIARIRADRAALAPSARGDEAENVVLAELRYSRKVDMPEQFIDDDLHSNSSESSSARLAESTQRGTMVNQQPQLPRELR